MGRAKQIIVKVIPKKMADDFVRKFHYSGKVVATSFLHFGVFINDALHGALQFGAGIAHSRTMKLVKNTGWREFIELNRMAFDNVLPRNSESRAISIAIKLIKKNAPQIKWIISFSDGTQSGDGTIYRASGFKLIDITKNSTIYRMPDGKILAANLIFNPSVNKGSKQSKELNQRYGKVGEMASWSASKFLKHIGAEALPGYQLKYIFLIDKGCELTVPVLPFSKIDELDAGMYRGRKIPLCERKRPVDETGITSCVQQEFGGSNPTTGLSETNPMRAESIGLTACQAGTNCDRHFIASGK